VSYGFKLWWLSLAAFFLVHFAAAMAMGWLAPVAIRMAGRMRSRAAARFLLTVRFAPLGIAIFVVAALCVPSYLWFEPDVAEEVGPACLLAAVLCVGIWAISLSRSARAILKSRRWLRQCERTGCETRLAGGPAVIVDGNAVALAGLLRPRVIVASEVVRALSPEQLDAALRHERAHWGSRDNFKRLLLLIAPDAFPFFHGGFAGIERAWKKYAEWAADDRAASGDVERSLALAGALVRVARLGAGPQPSPLVTSLIDGDLSERVERLLRGEPEGAPDRWTPVVCALSALALAAVVLRPGALISVYGLLERLIR